MKPFKLLGTLLKPKFWEPTAGIDVDNVGWHKIGSGSSTLDHYHSNEFDNAYPSIKAIANAFIMIEPYTIDGNGKPVASNALDRVYTPNRSMSAADFREALAVMTLVHRKVYIRVHHSGSKVTPTSITGYTFLENINEMDIDGTRYYQLANGDKLGRDEVMELKNINPHNLGAGYSPTMAASKWIRLDDYIASYQAGFFANGAVPAGQFIITARTVGEFNDIVDKMQAHHRGAGKNNNVSYAHRAVDAAGKAQEANIEWVPFNTTNKELALKDLFEQANKKIDSSYGVPASIRGVNDQNTYASVRVDEVIFTKYCVNPIAMKIWSKFTHELNRITGGLGVAFTYDLELPQIADEEKVKAEAKQVELAIITSALAGGYSLDSVIEAFDLPNSYKLLKVGTGPATITNDKPEVASEEELNDTPEGETFGVIKTAKPKAITPAIRAEWEAKLAEVVYDQTKRQVDSGIAELDNNGSKKLTFKTKAIDPTDEEKIEFTARLLTVVLGLVEVEGKAQQELAMNLLLVAGINTDNVTEFALTAEQRANYASYLRKVADSYTTTTAEGIRAILQRGYENGQPAGAIKTQLQQFLAEEWRIKRVTSTEVNRAGAQASVDSMVNISDQTNIQFDKVWTHSGGDDPCEYCDTLIGTRIDVGAAYLPVGNSVITASGAEYKNDFHDVNGGSLHPNCHCLSTYRVRK